MLELLGRKISKHEKMTLEQTSRLTKIPEKVLLRMRSRESRSLKSGPPYRKTISAVGETIYIYLKKEVLGWMKLRRCLVTAGDAAIFLGISREEILDIYGLKGFNINSRNSKGRLIVDNAKNQYIWLPRK
jgi:hypothetical protein